MELEMIACMHVRVSPHHLHVLTLCMSVGVDFLGQAREQRGDDHTMRSAGRGTAVQDAAQGAALPG